MGRDYQIVDRCHNGEFLTYAKLILINPDGSHAGTEEFHGSSEFPGEDAVTQAISSGRAWVDAELPLEVRCAPWGLEWEREREEERLGHYVPLDI